MGIFIAFPWLALLPAALFLVLHRYWSHRITAVTALLWMGYALYEYGMRRRWLCSGECNIRVDLLLLYPMLIVLSVMSARATYRAWSGRNARRGPASRAFDP